MTLKISVIHYRNEPYFEDVFFLFDEENEGTIGRNADNSIVLPDLEKYVSKIHAKIFFRDGQFYLSNMSPNGTYLKNRDIELKEEEFCVLSQNDIITIGEYELLVTAPSIFKNITHPVDSQTIDKLADNPFENKEINSTSCNEDGWFPNAHVRPETTASTSSDWPKIVESGSSPASPIQTLNSNNSVQEQHSWNSSPQGWPPEPKDPVWFPPPIPPICKLQAEDASQSLICDPRVKQKWEIGRSESNDLILPEQLVSAKHATVSFNNGKFILCDHSTNGTELIEGFDTKKLHHAQIEIKDSAQLRIGSFYFSASISAPITPVPPAFAPDRDRLIADFFNGLGMDPLQLTKEQQDEAIGMAGKLLRSSIEGLVCQLQAREAFKKCILSDRTSFEYDNNNLLKTNTKLDEIIKSLFINKTGFLNANTSITEAFKDIACHQDGILKGFESTFDELVEQFDPLIFEKKYCREFAVMRNAKCWEIYCEKYPSLKEQFLENMLGIKFAEAYEACQRGLLDRRFYECK